MGNLVFQATLGGQVNLVGPNTASTFNLNVPAVAGTLVTTGDTGTVTNTMCATSVYTAPGTIGSGTPNTGAFTTLSATGVASFAAGSAAAPAITRTGDTDTGIFFPAANTLAFSTNGTEDARFDASGNLGLGVTPSAWGSGISALQVGAVTAVVNRSNQASFYSNTYNDGTNFRALITGFAGRYRIDSVGGSHAWDTAASVTAGSVQTITQAMTLDADGNLAVGATSVPGSNYRGYFLNSIASNAVTVGIRNTNSSGQSRLILGNDAGVARYTLGYTGTTSGGFGSSLAWIGTEAAEPLLFQTNGSERARFDPSGNFLVGATATVSGEKFHLASSTGSFTQRVYNSDASTPFGIYVRYTSANPSNTSSEFFRGDTNTQTRFAAQSNGGIANFSANNVNLSDRREKTNFAPAGDYLAKICAIPVQTFNFIDQDLESDDGLTLGVVAQDVQAVAPELVLESNWAASGAEPKMRLSIYQTDLQYALMKCIQEQQAIITQLQADVAALKG